MLFLQSVVVATATIIGLVGSAQAQAIVRGTLVDSLRNNAPIANATIELVATPWRAVTDAKGKFEFMNIPSGSYTVSYDGARVDTLGIASPQRDIVVADRSMVDVQLSTPGAARYFLTMCGLLLPDDFAMVRGKILGDSTVAVSDSLLSATWSETAIEGKSIDHRVVSSFGRVRATGEYTLCGVPRDVDVVVNFASGFGRETMGISVRATEQVIRRDFYVGHLGQTHRIWGRVTTAKARTGSIDVVDAITDVVLARADSNGFFTFVAPRVSRQVQIRSLGFTPIVREVDASMDSVNMGVDELVPITASLGRVLVEGERISPDRLGFDQRMKLKMGAFLDDSAIARAAAMTAGFIEGQVSFVRTMGRVGAQTIRIFPSYCAPRWFVDRHDEGNKLEPEIQAQELSRAKRMELYKAALAPAEFRDVNNCGSVVIWTH